MCIVKNTNRYPPRVTQLVETETLGAYHPKFLGSIPSERSELVEMRVSWPRKMTRTLVNRKKININS